MPTQIILRGMLHAINPQVLFAWQVHGARKSKFKTAELLELDKTLIPERSLVLYFVLTAHKMEPV